MAQLFAEFIGAHALAFTAALLVIVLAGIALLWRLFEAYYLRLWEITSGLWQRVILLPPLPKLRQRYPGVWSFLGNRLSPTGYLGLHLTLGLILCLVFLSAFSSLADEVGEREGVVQFDEALATELHKNATPNMVATFRIITELGNTPALAVVGVIVGLILILSRRWLLLASWAITLLGGGLLNTILKAFFQRPRPEFTEPLVVETYWSFPSGHAMGSLITYGMLVYLLVLLLKRWYAERLVIAGITLLVLLIGLSRMYLGVHFFSDVLAGYAAGAVWLAAAISGTEVARRSQLAQPHPSS